MAFQGADDERFIGQSLITGSDLPRLAEVRDRHLGHEMVGRPMSEFGLQPADIPVEVAGRIISRAGS